MNHKIKVLWCDRNIFTLSLQDFLSTLKHLDITPVDNLSEAREVLKKDSSYRLIICGSLFNEQEDGISFFKSLRLSGQYPQFLYFQVKLFLQMILA